MLMSIMRKDAKAPIGRYDSSATVEGPTAPTKRLRSAAKARPAEKTVPAKVESLDGVVHEWVREYQPGLFERIQAKETFIKDLAVQVEISVDAAMREALRQRLTTEKRELVALVWDAIHLFEGKPLTDPLAQGQQLGLLVEVQDPAGQSFYIPRGLLEQYLKEGYTLASPPSPAE